MITIEISGIDKLLSVCDPHRFVAEMDKGINRAAEVLRDETKRMPPVSAKTTGYGAPGIPVDTGRLRQSIQKQQLSLLAAGVVVPVDYAQHVYEGTSKMPGRPFFKWVLEDFNGLAMVQAVLNEALERVTQA